MVNFFQNVFLSDFIIRLLLLAILGVLSYWAIIRAKEPAGYALGWVASFFLMIAYGAIFGQPPAEPAQTEPTTLGVLGVIIPAIFGIMLGVAALILVQLNDPSPVLKVLKVAALTALTLIVIFFDFTWWTAERRMIGIFTLAFIVGGAFSFVIFSRLKTSVSSQAAPSSPFDDPPGQNFPPPRDPTQTQNIPQAPQNSDQPVGRESRLNQIREDWKRRNS